LGKSQLSGSNVEEDQSLVPISSTHTYEIVYEHSLIDFSCISNPTVTEEMSTNLDVDKEYGKEIEHCIVLKTFDDKILVIPGYDDETISFLEDQYDDQEIVKEHLDCRFKEDDNKFVCGVIISSMST
jgi:hypothetical protein